MLSLKASLGQLEPPSPSKELTRAYPREVWIRQKSDPTGSPRVILLAK